MKIVRPFLWISMVSLAACMYNVYGNTTPVQKEEVITFFPTLGYPVAKGALWELHIHGWIYEPHWITGWREELHSWFNSSPEVETTHQEDNETLSKQRSRAFFVDNQENKQVAIRLGDQTFTLDPSTANGHFTGILHVTAAKIEKWRQGNWVTFKAIMPPDDSRQFAGQVELLETQGISIISDIDDTIKISNVLDKSEMLANTFYRPFQAVPGMSQLYSTWAKQPGVSFHYVFASPWQLYEPLTEFLASSGFPQGTFNLRLFRWKDSSFIDFFKTSQPYKIDNINSLIECCFQRRFILIGDSGEQDPEVYAQIARKFPQHVIRILIRNVTGETAEAPRYQEVFKDLPKSLWTIFTDPATVVMKSD